MGEAGYTYTSQVSAQALFPTGKDISPSSTTSKLLRFTQPPNQWVLRAVSLRMKRLKLEADESLPRIADVYVFHLHDLIDN
jgi:hypothetical protein